MNIPWINYKKITSNSKFSGIKSEFWNKKFTRFDNNGYFYANPARELKKETFHHLSLICLIGVHGSMI